jgi:carboxyl-terminal processing protease
MKKHSLFFVLGMLGMLIIGGVVGFAAVPIAGAIESDNVDASTDLGFIAGVMQLVERYYVRPVQEDKLTEEALKGMLSRLDPHSGYMTETEFRQSAADMHGKFGGLGIEITKQGGLLKVISPIDDTPAAHAGLQPGDLIISVNGEATQGIDLEDIVSKIRGAPGTSIKLTIARGDKPPFDVNLVRSIIQIHSVKSQSEPNDVGYIRITRFDADTPSDFKGAIGNLKQAAAGGRLKGLVLDLRDDPGGLLTSAVGIASDLLNGGTVVSIRGRSGNDNQVYQASAKGDLLPNVPVAVLINGASASAAEIVAGALQDRHRATVLGTTSFGKGSVQTLIPLKGHGALRLTTALYYTPAGRSLQDNGVTPDIVVEVPKDQQIEGSPLLHESELHGAIANPSQRAEGNPANYSPPIKMELIATPQDSQLNAALAFLDRAQRADNNR